MMRRHIPTVHVDMIGEGITTNKVEDSSLLKIDDQLPEMMMILN
jgi:hypothetical protein